MKTLLAPVFLLLLTACMTGPSERPTEPPKIPAMEPTSSVPTMAMASSASSFSFSMPSDDELKEKLTPLQYDVTQRDGTEPAFENEYWDNTEEGIYVDIVSGEPLFSSKEKYKSGTGWPSFYAPLAPENIVEKKDFKLIFPRTEIRSKHADSHVGHVFTDGPDPTGLRYCMNSAALRFVPKDKLEEEGYGEYLEHFNE